MTEPQTAKEPLLLQDVIEKVRSAGDVSAAIYIQTFAQQKAATMNEAREEKRNAVRLAYGLLWHVQTENPLVHDARKTLLAWLNDKDQQKIGIEEAKEHINNMPAQHRRHDPYLDGP